MQPQRIEIEFTANRLSAVDRATGHIILEVQAAQGLLMPRPYDQVERLLHEIVSRWLVGVYKAAM